KTVVSNLARPGPGTDVYNLEVHAEHVYFVGENGVLVHNAGPKYSGRGAFGRDPAPKGVADDLILQSSRRDAWRSSFGQPSEGLGQLVRDLPKGHAARNDLARMLREIRSSGGAVSNKGLTGGNYARFSGTAGGRTGLFQYQPSKLRIADMLEEQAHWQQIRTGQHLRTYGSQSTVDVLEILAKQRVLQHPDITPAIRMEWLDDLARVRAGQYGQ
ncbi:MAG: hypothetical protein RIK87_04065, partial [Fuerstiella sp.]